MRVLLILTFAYTICAKISNVDINTKNLIIDEKIVTENEMGQGKRYKAEWSDLDTRPLPEWYDKAKIGIFLHWGIYSVPSFHSEWFWNYWKDEPDIVVALTQFFVGTLFQGKGARDVKEFMDKNYRPGFTYQDFGPMFTAEFFEPDKWAKLFANSGAKYIVLTSKHHEGYTLFPSKRSFSWNSVDVGPNRDLVGDLAKAVRNENLKFGVYHSLYEWYNPIYQEDKHANFTTKTYAQTKLWPDIKQLVNDYKPSVMWSDGDWEARDDYWNSTDLLAWLYNESPVKDEIVVNDRWGIDIPCHHGDFYNCADRYNPGQLQNHKWENAFTVDRKSWGFRRNMDLSDVMTIKDLLREVVSTVSCGGNALINVGPTKEGMIAPIFQERLLDLGEWLKINGEGIYDTSPWAHQNDTTNGHVWYTCTKTQYNAVQPTAVPSESDTITAVYAIVLEWPSDNKLKIQDVTSSLHSGILHYVELLGNEGHYLNWNINSGIVVIDLPDKATVKSKHAWTLRFTEKQNSST